jgi:hypothetical protein
VGSVRARAIDDETGWFGALGVDSAVHHQGSLGGEDAFNRATAAARDAVVSALRPMFEQAERALEDATAERDRIARGR